MNNSVSILLCTRNRAQSLLPTLHSLANVAVPDDWRVELLVVDNGSTDETPQIVSALAASSPFPVRLLRETRPGKSHALNTGVEAAKGRVVLFTDDDVRFPRDWIEGMCRTVLSGEHDIVQGGIRWAPHLLVACDQPAHAYLPRTITSTRHKTAEELSHGLIGANMAMLQEAIPIAAPFDPELGPGALGLGEETLLGWQLRESGCRFGLALDIEVEHHFDPRRLTREGLLAMARSKGRSLGYLNHHWHRQSVRFLTPRIWALRLKDLLRTTLTPSCWPGRRAVPEWKYSYQADLHRLKQLKAERSRPPKYRNRPARSPTEC